MLAVVVSAHALTTLHREGGYIVPRASHPPLTRNAPPRTILLVEQQVVGVLPNTHHQPHHARTTPYLLIMAPVGAETPRGGRKDRGGGQNPGPAPPPPCADSERRAGTPALSRARPARQRESSADQDAARVDCR